MLELTLSRSSQDDLRKLARQLRTVGDAKAIRRDLTKGLRAAARPAQQEAKAAALALPSKRPGSTGLRRQIAAATGTQVRTTGRNAGVKIRVSKKRMGDKARLPRLMNKGTWRHPVFGNREVWVTQTSRYLWFDRPLLLSGPLVRREIKKVLDDIERRLR